VCCLVTGRNKLIAQLDWRHGEVVRTLAQGGWEGEVGEGVIEGCNEFEIEGVGWRACCCSVGVERANWYRPC
jgi:hypothetical protein